MRLILPFLILLSLSLAASAASDISGPFGSNTALFGFSGRFPLAGRIGPGASGPPPSCGVGAIDASVGCPLPMLGM